MLRRLRIDAGGALIEKPGLALHLATKVDAAFQFQGRPKMIYLVVWKLDRLGRSVKNLVDLVGELRKQGVQFKSPTDAIDTGTASGRFFFHVMASLAEMERERTMVVYWSRQPRCCYSNPFLKNRRVERTTLPICHGKF